jgi:site-specific recombinase XerD
MTRCSSDHDRELSAFAATVGAGSRRHVLRLLRAAEAAAHDAGYSSLAATALDSGVLARWWRVACLRWNCRTRQHSFYRVRSYFEWLYQKGVVKACALRWVRGDQVARDGWVSLRLSRPIQRDIDEYLASFASHSAGHRRMVRCVLLDFERFWNQQAGTLGRRMLVAWLRDRLRRHRNKTEGFCLGILRKFLQAYPHHCPASRLPAMLTEGVATRRRVASLRAGRRLAPSAPAQPRTELTPHWEKFLRLKQRLGCRYEHERFLFRALDRFVCARRLGRLGDLTASLIESFVSGDAPRRARTLQSKHRMLRMLFAYLVARGVLRSDPSRSIRPRGLPPLKPYVYSHKEVERLLGAARVLPGELERGLQIYTLFHLVYACGLRAGEVRRLTLGDVDLRRRCLLIRRTKFYKDRLVPFNARVDENLRRLLGWRLRRYPQRSWTDPLFVNRHHRGFSHSALGEIFRRLRETAGIRPSISGQRACIHALRRTFAAHRLLRWYRETADVNVKLPLLATYMGHAAWEYTRVYLTMTPALMKTAGRRFAGAFDRALDEAP